MRAIIFVYIIEKVAHAHAKNAHFEWFSPTPGRLVGYPAIDICDIRKGILFRHQYLIRGLEG